MSDHGNHELFPSKRCSLRCRAIASAAAEEAGTPELASFRETTLISFRATPHNGSRCPGKCTKMWTYPQN